MSDVLSIPEPSTEAEYKVAVERIFTEMALMDERIAKDQLEIDRLKAETRAMLDELHRAQ